MKKKLAVLAATVLAMLALPASTMAAQPKTDVTGVVKDGSSVVSGAKVTVICNNNSKKTTTDATGTYLVVFNAANCPVGSSVSATAKKGHKGGVNFGTANGVTTRLNVAVVNVSIPEFGVITGITALAAGGAGFYLIRRRQLGNN